MGQVGLSIAHIAGKGKKNIPPPLPCKNAPAPKGAGAFRSCYWMEMALLLGSCFFTFLGTEMVRMPSSNLALTSSGSTASPT